MRDVIVEDDAGRPFWVTVLDDGVRVDRQFYAIAPDKARANPVPAHYRERAPVLDGDDLGIPAATLLHRLWRQRKSLEASRDKLPWWAWRKRALLTGAIRAYLIEWESAQVIIMGRVPDDDVRARFEAECG